MSDLDADPLAGATILGVLEQSERKLLASKGRSRRLDKGQILFVEGEESTSVLVLLSGHMKILRSSSDGDPFIVNTVVPGDSIGEIGVLSRGPRSATVQAGEESVVLELPASVIMELVSTRPAACIALLECMAGMVRRLTDVATDLVFLDLRQRVAKYLLEDRRAGSRSSTDRLTQSDLAASIGASRQRVNACLRDFERRGWISLESRRLRILDPEGLAAEAGL